MTDYIDRQAVIEEIKSVYEWHDTVTEDRLISHMRHLPSAQPEVIRCKDCKHRTEDGFCEGRGWPMQLVSDDGFCDKGERSEE